MAHYLRSGDVPPKRHTQHRDARGDLYYEELMGEEGFSSDSSLLYHVGIPSSVLEARAWELPDQATVPNHPLAPLHLKLHDLFPDQEWAGVDAVTGRRLVLGNADVRISYAVVGRTSPLYRNATGDECVYVESGTARVETVFGALEVGEGDYVILRGPRRTAGSSTGPSRSGCTASRRTATSLRRGATCRATGSCSSTRRTASGTCAPPSRWTRCSPGRAIRSRSTSSTGGAGREVWPAPSTWSRTTPSTWSAGTVACTPTSSTSPTSSRSPAGSTSRRRSTRSSRATTSWSATSCRARSTTTRSRSRCRTTTPTSTPTR